MPSFRMHGKPRQELSLDGWQPSCLVWLLTRKILSCNLAWNGSRIVCVLEAHDVDICQRHLIHVDDLVCSEQCIVALCSFGSVTAGLWYRYTCGRLPPCDHSKCFQRKALELHVLHSFPVLLPFMQGIAISLAFFPHHLSNPEKSGTISQPPASKARCSRFPWHIGGWGPLPHSGCGSEDEEPGGPLIGA